MINRPPNKPIKSDTSSGGLRPPCGGAAYLQGVSRTYAMSILDELSGLPLRERRRLLLDVWFQLTISGRAVWSDSELSSEQQLEGLKWLNEIQHRVCNAHRDPDHSPADLLAAVRHHITQAPFLDGHVAEAFRRALRDLSPSQD